MSRPTFAELLAMPGVMVARSKQKMLNDLPELVALSADNAACEKLRHATDVVIEPFEEPWGKRFMKLAEEMVVV